MQHLFDVQGMTCGHCEKLVTQALQRTDPGAGVRIDRSQNRVEVDSKAERAALQAAIHEAGYEVA
ncbi:heavy-metal-associated domain-containing protein [Comamonas endophytica]|uniref:Heavy-metal-associated domain-containing protein n=1 Tax=Comamonas endophytica TaxID=2949090 RepID=A0ABY6GFU7_9BURK|nr:MULTISPECIES: heavy-metal-associated domain-containing protein [unclassified Acidovorax]MCD2512444.1 heavy-metal-associated domain-containing protein [Acidovorax sp. D4N7]UYG53185.1 heavy-metal-associated domain-containing protein [Acidovorax sp. 5MLIR]